MWQGLSGGWFWLLSRAGCCTVPFAARHGPQQLRSGGSQQSRSATLGLRRSLAQIWAHQSCVSNPAPAPPRARPSPLAALPGSVVISQPSRRSRARGRLVCPARSGGAELAEALEKPAGGERALSLRARGILAVPQADRLWPGVNIPLAWCPAQGGWRALAFNNLFIFPYCRNDDSFHY